MDVVEPGELVVVEQEGGRVQDQLRGGPGQDGDDRDDEEDDDNHLVSFSISLLERSKVSGSPITPDPVSGLCRLTSSSDISVTWKRFLFVFFHSFFIVPFVVYHLDFFPVLKTDYIVKLYKRVGKPSGWTLIKGGRSPQQATTHFSQFVEEKTKQNIFSIKLSLESLIENFQ